LPQQNSFVLFFIILRSSSEIKDTAVVVRTPNVSLITEEPLVTKSLGKSCQVSPLPWNVEKAGEVEILLPWVKLRFQNKLILKLLGTQEDP
jgi:hypothetical protein